MFDNETLQALGDVLARIENSMAASVDGQLDVTIDEHEIVRHEGKAILEFTTSEGRQYQVTIVQTNADEEAVDE